MNINKDLINEEIKTGNDHYIENIKNEAPIIIPCGSSTKLVSADFEVYSKLTTEIDGVTYYKK